MMRKNSRLVAALMILLVLGGRAMMPIRSAGAQSSKASAMQMATYGNARFRYFIDYPKNFFAPMREADNGDGRGFLSRDGKGCMFVYGSNNVSDETIHSRFAKDSRPTEFVDKVTYKVQKANWYVVSGYRGAGIFYRKCFLRDGQFITLDISYPKTERAIWDKLVGKITPTFRLGK